jgi:hypothetical protein
VIGASAQISNQGNPSQPKEGMADSAENAKHLPPELST